MYVPSVQYTLPQTYFTQKELDRTQRESMARIFSKCGYNKNTARALLYAPLTVAGGGFLSWHLLQGEGQIRLFMKHWRTDTIISKTLRATLAWAQWQAGIHESILTNTVDMLPHLECRWINSLRNFLHHIHGTIVLDQPFLTLKETKHDIHIMTYAIQSGLFSREDLQVINYCRMYLHITTVSELFSADGKTMIPDLFQCRREPWFDPKTYVVLQKRPSSYHIRYRWKKLCRQWVKESGHIAESLNLGTFIVPGHHLRRRRQTYLNIDDSTTVYHWNEGGYKLFRRDPSNNHFYVVLQPTDWTPIASCQPVQAKVQFDGSLIIQNITSRAPPVMRIGRPSQTTSFSTYIASLPDWERHLLEGIQLHVPPYGIVQYMSSLPHQTRTILVSDGSVLNKGLAFGWVYGADDRTILAEHAGVGLGEPTSHRAESWGLLSGILFLHHLYQYTNSGNDAKVQSRSLTVFSDNMGLVTRVSQRLSYHEMYPNATLAPDWDLIEQIYTTFTTLPHNDKEVQWVKGHQDTCNDDVLTTEAHFNIIADRLAGESVRNYPNMPPPQYLLPAARCQLKLCEQVVSSHYTTAIRQAYALPTFHAYLEKRHGWNSGQSQTVDWKVFRQAITSGAFSSVQLLKLVHDKFPTNSELSKTNGHQTPNCSYCDQRETFHHLLTCDNELSSQFRSNLFNTCTTYMVSRNVPTSVSRCIIYCLKMALLGESTHCLDHTPPYLVQCVNKQKSIGFSLFLQGFWTTEWRLCINKTLRHYGSDPHVDSIDILSGLLKSIWQAQFEYWTQHLQERHKRARSSAQAKLIEYQTKIRVLHKQREQCLHGHRDLYFYNDVKAFLSTATGTQMRQYLHHYEPAITASIKAARHQPQRTLLTFPGFLRTRISQATARVSNLHPSTNVPTTFLKATRGALSNRKHTRWRTSSQSGKSLRHYFSSPPT